MGYIDVVRTGYIVVYHGSAGDRFIQTPAHKRYRGMYRNRRLVGVDKAVWSPDRDKARAFSSRSDAERQIRLAGIPANSKTIVIETTKRTAQTWVKEVLHQ
jgi:hypothetical protein